MHICLLDFCSATNIKFVHDQSQRVKFDHQDFGIWVWSLSVSLNYFLEGQLIIILLFVSQQYLQNPAEGTSPFIGHYKNTY